MANKVGICSIDGCGKIGPLTLTWCHMHYRRYRKTGSTGVSGQMRAPANSTPAELLEYWGWVVSPTGCWEANGRRNEDGYVVYNSSSISSSGKISAHRASFLAHKGEIPEGQEVCHACDNPPCINPDHLYAGTHRQNMLDRSLRGRVPGTVLNPDEVRRIRKLVASGLSDAKVAKTVGKSAVETVRNVRIGKTWGWVE